MASGSRHEFLLENEDSGTYILFLMLLMLWMFVSCVVFVDGVNVNVVIVVIIFSCRVYALHPVKNNLAFNHIYVHSRSYITRV